jgi:hypothetical protein
MLFPKGFDERSAEFAARQDIDVAVDGFVRDAHGHIKRILLRHASLYLAGRPFTPQTQKDIPAQAVFPGQTTLTQTPGGGAGYRFAACREG